MNSDSNSIYIFDKPYILNDQQKPAVTEFKNNICVDAGAGAGKTSCLIGKIAYLVYIGYDPTKIVAITFTKKAYHEMKSRLIELIGEELTNKVNIGTIHSYAYRTLQTLCSINFTILDDSESKLLMNTILENNPSDIIYNKKLSRNIYSIYAMWRDGMYPATLEEICKKQGFGNFSRNLQRLYEEYEKDKKRLKYLDFCDIMMKFYDMLQKNDETVNSYIESIQFILVDEAQDINQLQSNILQLLNRSANNMTFYGDDWQSIYRFRGGSMKHLIEFCDLYTDSKLLKLEYNYRSTPEIVFFCNQIMRPNHNQIEKIMIPTIERSGKKPFVKGFDNEIIEANWICNKIEDIQNNDKSIVILARNNNELNVFEMLLLKRSITYKKLQGISFLDAIHIKDIISLWTALDRNSPIHWRRILRLFPTVTDRIANEMLNKCGNRIIRTLACAITYFNRELCKNIIPLSLFLKRYSKLQSSKISITEKFEKGSNMSIEFLSDIYMKDFESNKITHNVYTKRVHDLQIMKNELIRYGNYKLFLESLQLEWVDEQWMNKSQTESVSTNSPVIMSTIHSAKGLEWDVVFVKGLTLGHFPNSYASDPIEYIEDIEEERRLFFVACSRAKNELYLTYSGDRKPMNLKNINDMYNNKLITNNYISAFISQIPVGFYDSETIICFPEKIEGRVNITERIKCCLCRLTTSACWDIMNSINISNMSDELKKYYIEQNERINNKNYNVSSVNSIQWGSFIEMVAIKILFEYFVKTDNKIGMPTKFHNNDSEWIMFMDEKTHFKDILKQIYLIANSKCNVNQIQMGNREIDIWNNLKNWDVFEKDIQTLIDFICKQHNIDHAGWNYHISLSCGKIFAELDVYHDSGILIEFKCSKYNVFNMYSWLQGSMYSYLLRTKDKIVNDIYWYNFLTRELIHNNVPSTNILCDFWKKMNVM